MGCLLGVYSGLMGLTRSPSSTLRKRSDYVSGTQGSKEGKWEGRFFYDCRSLNC